MSREEDLQHRIPWGDSPNNCNVNERTADGVFVGRCWFYLKDGVCPRHGKVK